MHLRPAASDDFDAILQLWREAEAEPTHTDDVDGVTQLLAHDPHALLLAEDDGQVVGTVIAGWDGWRGSIYRIVVAPTHRRRGLGRRLIDEAEQRFERLGARRRQAIIVDTDTQAMGFWKASGWEQQTERVRFVSG